MTCGIEGCNNKADKRIHFTKDSKLLLCEGHKWIIKAYISEYIMVGDVV